MNDKKNNNMVHTSLGVLIILLVVILFISGDNSPKKQDFSPAPVEWSDNPYFSKRITRDFVWDFYVPFENIRSIYVEGDNLWCGNPYGLWRHNLTNKKWQVFTDLARLNSASANQIISNGKSMWFGTSRGLARYNENSETIDERWYGIDHFNEKSLANIAGITFDGEKYWCATIDGSIASLDNELNDWVIFEPDKESFDDARVSMYLAPTGFSFEEWKKIRKDPYAKKRSELREKFDFEEFAPLEITGMFYRNGSFWLSGSYGFIVIDPVTRKSSFKSLDSETIKFIEQNKFKDVDKDLGADAVKTPKQKKYKVTDADVVKYPVQIGDNTYFVISDTIFRIDKERKVKRKYTGQNHIKYMATFDNKLYFIEGNNKVYRYTPSSDAFDEIKVTNTCGNIISIFVNEKYRIFGCKSGLVLNDLAKKDIKIFQFSKSPSISGIVDVETPSQSNTVSNSDLVWVGTVSKGLYSYNKMSKEWKHYNEIASGHNISVRDIKIKNDKIWCATNRGLFSMNDNGSYQKLYTVMEGMSNDNVNCLYIRDEEIWCGTSNGLSKFDPSNSQWHRYGKESGSPITDISCIAFNNHWCFVGGNKGGLAYFKITDTPSWKHLFNSGQFNGYQVLSILSEKDVLWLGTSSGLFKVLINEKLSGDLELLTEYIPTPDGIYKDDSRLEIYSLSKTSQGILCGTDRGLILLDNTGKMIARAWSKDAYNNGSIADIAIDSNLIWCVAGGRLTSLREEHNGKKAIEIFTGKTK